MFRGGTYNQNIVITKSGTEDNYITIRNYPNESLYSTTQIMLLMVVR